MGMVVLSGCILEDLTQFGEACPGLSYIQKDDDKCERDSCSWGNLYFNVEKCPEDQPYCIAIPGDDVYCASLCPNNTHELSDEVLEELKDELLEEDREGEVHRCEADTVWHCGSSRSNCAEESGWRSGKCEDQQCVAEKCTEMYRADKGICKPYGACCGQYCAHCTDVKNKNTGKPWVCSGQDDTADCLETCPDGMNNRDGLCIDSYSG